ncbi:MAG: hypothetical protein QG620_566 [Patescibacteria group bacterium]|nr:hypothetical protein [Patescibacteria group bacterium]
MNKAGPIARRMLSELKEITLPIPIEDIAQKNGIQIKYEEFESEDISGALKGKSKEGNPVIIVNKKHSSERQRFTIAHELGHYILHSKNALFIDRGAFIFHRDDSSSQGVNKQEIEANQFAAEILMPVNSLKKDYFENSKLINGDDPSRLIEKLAEKYQVSQQSMAIRISKFIY